MLKLITGVILLIIILFTSHYILVDKYVENFNFGTPSTGYTTPPGGPGGDKCRYCNYTAVHQKSSDYNSPTFINYNCCNCFLNNPEEMYNNYKTVLEEDPDLSTPNSYKDVHQTMLSRCKTDLLMDASENASQH